MDKKTALKKMKIAINNYENHLNNCEFLILYKDCNNTFHLNKIAFIKNNFFHLTGVEANFSPKKFYERLLSSKLNLNDFDFNSNGTTTLKLDVIEDFHLLFFSSCYIGNYNSYNYSKIMLSTDVLVGKKNFCLGMKFIKEYHIPNTLLKEKMSPLVSEIYPVICTLKKSSFSKEYEYTYLNDHHSKEEIEKELKNFNYNLS